MLESGRSSAGGRGLPGSRRGVHQAERRRAEEYYAAAVDSLEDRQVAATAPEDRRRNAAARSGDTSEERVPTAGRDRRKISAAPRDHARTGCTCSESRWCGWRPDVRRGSGATHSDLDWLLPAGEFASLRVPGLRAEAVRRWSRQVRTRVRAMPDPRRPAPSRPPESVPPPATAGRPTLPTAAERAVPPAPVQVATVRCGGRRPRETLRHDQAGAAPRSRGRSEGRATHQASTKRAPPTRPGSRHATPTMGPATAAAHLSRRQTNSAEAGVRLLGARPAGAPPRVERLCATGSPAAALLRLYGAARAAVRDRRWLPGAGGVLQRRGLPRRGTTRLGTVSEARSTPTGDAMTTCCAGPSGPTG